MVAAFAIVGNVQKFNSFSVPLTPEPEFFTQCRGHPHLRGVQPDICPGGSFFFYTLSRQSITVQIAGKYQMDGRNIAGVKAVSHLGAWTQMGISASFLGTINTVGSVLAVADGVRCAGQFCVLADLRDGSDSGGQEAILVEKFFLEQRELLQIDIVGCQIILYGNCGGFSHGLAEQTAGGHDPGAAHCHMGGADVPAGEEQVVYVLGV